MAFSIKKQANLNLKKNTTFKISRTPFLPSSLGGLALWLKADAGVNKVSYNYISEIIISGTSNPSFAGTYTTSATPDFDFDSNTVLSYSFTGPAGKTMSWSDGDGYFLLSSSGEPNPSFYSHDGVNWTAISYIAQIVITGFSGIYAGANGTYNGDGYYFTRVGGGFYIEGDTLKDSETESAIAIAPANYSGAWTPTNYASRVVLSGATNATVINGNYDATEAFLVNLWANSNGSYIYFDGQYIVTNENFSNAYSSGDSEDWSGSPEPAPSGAVTHTPRSVGSPTSTSSSKPTGSVSGVVTITTVNTDYVDNWIDQSGNGRNGNRAGAVTLPVIIGGKSFINFPSGKRLFAGAIWSNTPFTGTILVVARFASSSAGGRAHFLYQEGNSGNFIFGRGFSSTNGFFVTNNETDYVYSNTVVNNNTNYIIETTFNSSSASLYLNGVSVGSASIPSNNGTINLDIGGGDEPFNIAEMIVYNRVLTTEERQQVEAYLNSKYQIY